MSANAAKQLADADQLRRTVARIAHEIVEAHADPGQTMLAGIHTRGVPLAARLVDHIERFTGARPTLGTLDIALYRDDVASGALPVVGETEFPRRLADGPVILVDDVLHTGRTIRAAIDELFDFGRPPLVQLAVLVDRGHRELPIRPDFVGRNLPTSRGERVHVRLSETDGTDEILLVSEEPA